VPKYSVRRIIEMLNDADSATTADGKGDRVEDVVQYLFTKINGVSLLDRDIIDKPRAHEIDICLYNEAFKSRLSFLEAVVLVECKHTGDPVGSMAVSWFAQKLRARGLPSGVLVSLNGVTGAADGTSNAHSEILTALSNGTRILLVDRSELLSLRHTDDLVELLRSKFVRLVVHRTVQ
jgi:hypothetical protein